MIFGKKSKSVTQKEKSKFRRSSKWKNFRNYLRRKRCVDYITQKPLYAGWNLHHLDLDKNHYEDISDESKFECLNKKTHDVVHFLYQYYIKDKMVIARLTTVLEKMKIINGGEL